MVLLPFYILTFSFSSFLVVPLRLHLVIPYCFPYQFQWLKAFHLEGEKTFYSVMVWLVLFLAWVLLQKIISSWLCEGALSFCLYLYLFYVVFSLVALLLHYKKLTHCIINITLLSFLLWVIKENFTYPVGVEGSESNVVLAAPMPSEAINCLFNSMFFNRSCSMSVNSY